MSPISQMVQMPNPNAPRAFVEFYAEKCWVYASDKELICFCKTPNKARQMAENLNKLIRGEAKLQKPKRW